MNDLVFLSGQPVHIGTPAVTWMDHGMVFERGRGARARKRKIDLVVLHWTGGENEPPAVFETLEKRELGIEFAIGSDGLVWQFCDPSKIDTFDAGKFNGRSVGIEMVNYGHRPTLRQVPTAGLDRWQEDQVIHGRGMRVANFYRPQMDAMVRLVDRLCDWYQIPKQYPYAKTVPECIEDFKGVAGHFHLTTRKTDPGLEPFRHLNTKGFKSWHGIC